MRIFLPTQLKLNRFGSTFLKILLRWLIIPDGEKRLFCLVPENMLSISQNAHHWWDCFRRHLWEWSLRSRVRASGGVYRRLWIVALKKQVLPRLLSPPPTPIPLIVENDIILAFHNSQNNQMIKDIIRTRIYKRDQDNFVISASFLWVIRYYLFIKYFFINIVRIVVIFLQKIFKSFFENYERSMEKGLLNKLI